MAIASSFRGLPNTGLFKAVGERMTEAQVTGSGLPDTAANASVTVAYFAATHALVVKGSYASLPSPLLAAGTADAEGNPPSGLDIALGAAGTDGPVLRNLTVTPTATGSGTFSGRYTLSPAEEAAYAAGNLYVTARTEAHPAGELRGQIDSVVAATLVSAAEEMTPEQVAPPVPTPVDPGTGTVGAYYDPGTRVLIIAGTYADLSSDLAVRGNPDPEGNAPTAIHLHSAAPGENGGVGRNLTAFENGDGSGTFGGAYTLRPGEAADFLAGNGYAFIHTETNYGGELRGQIDTFVTTTGHAGTNAADTLAGAAANDVSLGRGGADLLTGGGGDDILDGGTGADTMDGGAGDDGFIVDNVGDVVVEAIGGGTDTVQAASSYRLGANLENLILAGTAATAFSGRGNALANVITGDDGNNLLDGLAGTDRLEGGAGDDALYDRTGGDTLVGGAGDDTYYLSSGTIIVEDADTGTNTSGTDTARAAFSATLAANVERLFLAGVADLSGTGNALDNMIAGNAGANRIDGLAGNDSLVGGDGADTLLGGAGDDRLTGGTGDDRLEGGAGEDRLIGGAGADTFAFGTGRDTVNDFEDGADLLDVTAFRAANGGAPLEFADLLVTQRATSVTIALDLDQDGRADAPDLDGDGAGDAVLIVLLSAQATAIGTSDFLL